MPMTRAQFKKQLQEGLNTVFGMEYGKWPELWRHLFDTETSTKAFEEDVLLSGFGPAPVKAEGAPITYDQMEEGGVSRYTNVTIAMAFALTEEAEEDGLYGSLAKKGARFMAESMQTTKEVRGAAVYNNAHDSTVTGFDGKAMCATDHPLKGGGTAQNRLTTAADLSITSLEDVLIGVSQTVNDRGIPKLLHATKLAIPTDLRFTAESVLASVLRPGSMNNDVNAVKSLGVLGSDDVCMTPYFTSASTWFVRTNAPDGAKHFKRKAMQKKVEGDFETTNTRYRARERYVFGWTDWRGVYSSGV